MTSSDDVSQAPEVGPTHETTVADSESRDSDVGTTADVSPTRTECLEEVQVEWERAVVSYKIIVQDQKLRMEVLARENQDHDRAHQDLEDLIQVLEAQGHKLGYGQNAQMRELASLTRVGEEALEELEADI